MLTFVDSSVLIAAATGIGPGVAKCQALLADPELEFASSPFVVMEVEPPAKHNRRDAELAYYESFFEAVAEWATDYERIVGDALEACRHHHGLKPFDALLLASAASLGADQFVTLERQSSPLLKAKLPSLRVVSVLA